MRLPEVGVAALAVAAILTWLAALLTSLPPPAPVFVVQGEPAVVAGSPWALRIVAVAPGGHAPLEVTGAVRLVAADAANSAAADATSAPFVHGAARVERARPGRAELDVVAGGVRALGVVELRALDAAPSVGVVPGVPPGALRWTPWYGEVAMRSDATAPLYPLDGRVSSRMPSRVLVLDPAGPRVVDLAPSASGAQLPDGRVLQVDRGGLRVEPRALQAPPSASAGRVRVDVTVAEPADVSCDLLVDGVVRDVVTQPLAPISSPSAVALPDARAIELRAEGLEAAALVVVHCGGPFPDALGRAAVVPPALAPAALAAHIRAVARAAGAPGDEPLLALDDAALAEPDVARAAFARLSPKKVRAPRLDVVWTIERGPGAVLRGVYAGLAVGVVVAALALGLARMPRRRGAVLAGVGALMGVLGGLYAALVVIAR